MRSTSWKIPSRTSSNISPKGSLLLWKRSKRYRYLFCVVFFVIAALYHLLKIMPKDVQSRRVGKSYLWKSRTEHCRARTVHKICRLHAYSSAHKVIPLFRFYLVNFNWSCHSEHSGSSSHHLLLRFAVRDHPLNWTEFYWYRIATGPATLFILCEWKRSSSNRRTQSP